MSYNPVKDFLGLVRNTTTGASLAAMPGLDFVMAALARAGLFSLSVGQTAPIVNQATTVWLQPSLPSWVAEGRVFLWDPVSLQYLPATPALWIALLTPSGATSFQSITGAVGLVAPATTLFAIKRAAPAATVVALPSVALRSGQQLRLVDWSTSVVNHSIIITPAAGETIMQLSAFQLLSTVDQLAGVTLYPSVDLAGWVLTP